MAETQNYIRFLLGGSPQKISDFDPNRTLLDYLRCDVTRTGTKEGCGEGDCGACTVVVGSLKQGKLHFEAVNACILFLPTLDSKLLLTVEDLISPDGKLHAVQKTLAALHGSQCGFCTPGFVMSLFAHVRSGGGGDLDSINNALVGNLCRCTGYGPIIEAARTVLAETMDDHLTALEQGWTDQLAAMESRKTVTLSWSCSDSGETRHYHAPKTPDALARLCAKYPGATLLAGGTDVGLWVTKQLRTLNNLIYLGQVTELAQITETETHMEIGAAVTFTRALPLLTRHFPDFGEVVRRLGSIQIRNRATLGGNIANGSPIGDSMPLLIALNTELILQSVNGIRHLPLEDYFIAYGKQDLAAGEFVARIRIPKLASDQYFRAYKISKRFDQDISAVCAGFRLTLRGGKVTNARIAYGGMAATPKRAGHAERALTDVQWSEENITAAMQALGRDFTPMSDMRASADYRLLVAQNLLMKAYVESVKPETATRLVGSGGRHG